MPLILDQLSIDRILLLKNHQAVFYAKIKNRRLTIVELSALVIGYGLFG